MSSTILIVRLKAFHPYYINRFVLLAKQLIQPLSFVEEKQFFLPRRRERFTVLRSPHVDKKSREQFERRTSQRIIRWTFSNLKNKNSFYLYSFFRNLSKISVGVQLQIVSVTRGT